MEKVYEIPNSVGTWCYNNSPETVNCYEDDIGDDELFLRGNWVKISDEVTRPRLTIDNQITRSLQDKFRAIVITQREQIQEDLRCILDGLDNTLIDNVCQVIVDRFQIILEDSNVK